MRRLSTAFLTLLLALAWAGTPAWAVPSSTEITITGGGWGHGVGMAQYGAKGMADSGSTHPQILAHFYQGTALADLSSTSLNVPDPLRVGIHWVDSNGAQRFDRTSVSFTAINGNVSVCLSGETSTCSYTAVPGDTWNVSVVSGKCTLKKNDVVQASGLACGISMKWSGQPTVRLSIAGKIYARGSVQLLPVGSPTVTSVHMVVDVGIEEYVYGIGEMPKSWDLDALKAQAIASRTYGAKIAAARASAPLSVCSCHLRDSTSDQVYLGWSGESDAVYGPIWRSAVDGTSDDVVTYNGSVAETYYFSSTGGRTENVGDVWGSNQASYPYLVSVDEPWSADYANSDCKVSKIRWCRSTTAGTIAAAYGMSEVTSVSIIARYVSGSPSDIVIRGLDSKGADVEKHATGGAFMTALGLRSGASHHVYTIEGFGVPRLAGANRYSTATAVSKYGYPSGADVVYVATGEHFPDALAGGAAAAHEAAPVLLVQKSSIPSATKSELSRLSPGRIVVLGGTAVIDDQVVTDLRAYAGTVTRVAGANRYATSAAVSKAAFTSSNVAYVATGVDFPDALAAVPAAVQAGAPLLLVRPDELPTVVSTELKRLGATSIVVVGGVAAISADVVSSLAEGGRSVTRIDGATRYALSANVSKATFAAGGGVAYVVVGTEFPDALSAGALTGPKPGPVLLVQTDSLPAVVANELTRLAPGDIYIVGGPAVVSDSVSGVLSSYVR